MWFRYSAKLTARSGICYRTKGFISYAAGTRLDSMGFPPDIFERIEREEKRQDLKASDISVWTCTRPPSKSRRAHQPSTISHQPSPE